MSVNEMNGIMHYFTTEFWLSEVLRWVPIVWSYWPLIFWIVYATNKKFRSLIISYLKFLFNAMSKEFFDAFEDRFLNRLDTDVASIKHDISDLKGDVHNVEERLVINTSITIEAAKIQIRGFCIRIMNGEIPSALEIAVLKRLYSHYKMLGGNGEMEEEYNRAMDKLKVLLDDRNDK